MAELGSPPQVVCRPVKHGDGYGDSGRRVGYAVQRPACAAGPCERGFPGWRERGLGCRPRRVPRVVCVCGDGELICQCRYVGLRKSRADVCVSPVTGDVPGLLRSNIAPEFFVIHRRLHRIPADLLPVCRWNPHRKGVRRLWNEGQHPRLSSPMSSS